MDSAPPLWHTLTPTEILERFGTSRDGGLSSEEAARRLADTGPNAIREMGGRSRLAILAEQFTSLMVVILIVAAAISFLIGDVQDAVVILAIVVLNSALGFVQEFRAEQAVAALKRLAVPAVRVRRDGHVRELSAEQLVPGDIIYLEMGSRVPADARLLDIANLRVEQAALTGESVPVEKTVDTLDADLAPADQRNMIFMGTTVTYGRGSAVVTTTGMQTQLGRIAELIQTVKGEATPLQRRLDSLGRTLAAAALAIVAVVFVAGLVRGLKLELMILTAIGLAVAAVPEGLPAVITIALALGAQRMVERSALIRKLPAVETLGSVTTICSDKTGTLTQNQMTVTVVETGTRTIAVTGQGYQPVGEFIELRRAEGVPAAGGSEPLMVDAAGTRYDGLLISTPDGVQPFSTDDAVPAQARLLEVCADEHLCELLRAGALCNDSVLEQDENGGWHIVGDPTEGALVVAAAKAGFAPAELSTAYPRTAEIPFTSERKRMTTLHHTPEEHIVAFCKGAVDRVLEVCTSVQEGTQIEPLPEDRRAAILEGNDRMAELGLRILGLAHRHFDSLDQALIERDIERKLTFLGLVGMIDPARPEAAEAVRRCRAAGIRAVMITGDHPLTARAIGRALGMLGEGDRAVVGAELETMDAAELADIVDDVAVYARVSPEHKLKIVEALQQKRQIVAMTGDGVNDAPALKKADIGVAMGITGTDVSKEAADMVLLDDNFATIVAAVEEGRVIYDNIRKFVRYLLSTNTGEIVTMLFAILGGLPLPVLPIQILWINLVTDGLPAVALGFEPAEPGVMRRPPRNPDESVFVGGLGGHILRAGLLIGLGTLAVLVWALRTGRPEVEARTMAFTTLALFQVWHVMAVRSETQLLVHAGLFSNPLLLGAVVLTFVLQLAVTYLPPLQGIFQTVALSPTDLGLCLGVSSLGFFLVEIQKLFYRRGS